MSWIKKSLLGLLAASVFIWVFLVSLLLQAPAGWLVYQAQQGGLAAYVPADARPFLAQVDAQALQGRLGRGEAHNLQLAGVELAEVSWRLPWWRLALLYPEIQLKLGEPPVPWELSVAMTPTGAARIHLDAGSLESVRGLPVAFQGRLEGRIEANMTWNQGQWACQTLKGRWQGGLRLQSPMQVDLGRVSLEPECPAADALAWRVGSRLEGEHQVELEGQTSGQSWRFTAQAQVHDQAELAPLLNMLGWRHQGAIQEGDVAPGQRLEARGGGRL